MIEIWISDEADSALDMDDLPTVEGLVPWAPPERPAPGGPGWSLDRGRTLRGRRTTLQEWRMSRPTAEWLLGEIDWRLECWRGGPRAWGETDPTGELERGSQALRRARATIEAALSTLPRSPSGL